MRVLVDPIIVRQDLEFRRATHPRWYYDDDRGFDAVFISHGHNDHLHPPSLLGLDSATPIYFFDEEAATCSCVDDENPQILLPALGFHDIHAFRDGQSIEVGGGITIHILPARESLEGEEQCCFIIETPDLLMLDAVDIKDAPETRRALKPFRGKLDLAYLPTGAALQFQGFWNQMDAIEAVRLCEWLNPKRVATCGGSLSLSERPRTETLERYPKDLVDWFSTASERLGTDKLLAHRPPVRLRFENHELITSLPVTPSLRFAPRNGLDRPQAPLAAMFTGYHPRWPTKRCYWPGDNLRDWLSALAPLKDLARSSIADLSALLQRCEPKLNKSPFSQLAPTTLRYLNRHQLWDTAAAMSSHIPDPPDDPDDLDLSFFAVVEAILENQSRLSANRSSKRSAVEKAASKKSTSEFRQDLRMCLWIDRHLFQLRRLGLRLSGLASYPAPLAKRLVEEHIQELETTIDQRRPLLGCHHLHLERDQIELYTGEPPNEDVAGLLCYATVDGLKHRQLSQIENHVLGLCDGRTFAELAENVGSDLQIPDDDARPGIFGILAGLSRESVLLVDWSHR